MTNEELAELERLRFDLQVARDTFTRVKAEGHREGHFNAAHAKLLGKAEDATRSLIATAREAEAPRAENARLRAENARLREYIAKQANTINVVGSPYHKAQEALDELVLAVKREARAALEKGDVK